MKKRILSLLLALVMLFALAACGSSGDTQESADPGSSSNPDSSNPGNEGPEDTYYQTRPIHSTDVYGTDYTDLYSYMNKNKTISIDEVWEDESTGLAYLERDGVRYELGLDFLTMAMVYNCAVPEGGRWQTQDDVYATWWKLYIQRWNYLLPEIPLYSNEYYDIYNAQIKGVEEYPTNPYWSPASALIDWTSEKDDNSIIIGNTTELAGRFRWSSFGVSSPGAGDLDVESLITGLETIATTKEGGYEVNATTVDSYDDVVNADGTRTFTVKIKNDLVFSDGSPITAKNYLVTLLMNSSPVGVQAQGTGRSGQLYEGFAAFSKYDGTNDGVDGASKAFSGVRLLDDYTYSFTVAYIHFSDLCISHVETSCIWSSI